MVSEILGLGTGLAFVVGVSGDRGIVYLRIDPLLQKPRLYLFPVLEQENEQVVGVALHERHIERLAVSKGNLPATIQESRQLAELADSQSCLNVAHPEIQPWFLHQPIDSPVVPKLLEPFVVGLIVRRDHAALAGRNRLHWVKRVASHVGRCAYVPTFVDGPESVTGILDNDPRLDGVHVRRSASEVHGDSHLGLEVAYVPSVVYVPELGPAALYVDRVCRGGKCEGYRYDVLTVTNPRCVTRCQERRGAVVDSQRIPRADVLGKLRLKLAHLRALGEPV